MNEELHQEVNEELTLEVNEELPEVNEELLDEELPLEENEEFPQEENEEFPQEENEELSEEENEELSEEENEEFSEEDNEEFSEELSEEENEELSEEENEELPEDSEEFPQEENEEFPQEENEELPLEENEELPPEVNEELPKENEELPLEMDEESQEVISLQQDEVISEGNDFQSHVKWLEKEVERLVAITTPLRSKCKKSIKTTESKEKAIEDEIKVLSEEYDSRNEVDSAKVQAEKNRKKLGDDILLVGELAYQFEKYAKFYVLVDTNDKKKYRYKLKDLEVSRVEFKLTRREKSKWVEIKRMLNLHVDDGRIYRLFENLKSIKRSRGEFAHPRGGRIHRDEFNEMIDHVLQHFYKSNPNAKRKPYYALDARLAVKFLCNLKQIDYPLRKVNIRKLYGKKFANVNK